MYLFTSNLVGGQSHCALSRRLVALAFAARMRASDLRVRMQCAYVSRLTCDLRVLVRARAYVVRTNESLMLTHADACRRMLTYADVC